MKTQHADQISISAYSFNFAFYEKYRCYDMVNRRDTYCFTGVLKCSRATTRICTRKMAARNETRVVQFWRTPLISFPFGVNANMHANWILDSFPNVKWTFTRNNVHWLIVQESVFLAIGTGLWKLRMGRYYCRGWDGNPKPISLVNSLYRSPFGVTI